MSQPTKKRSRKSNLEVRKDIDDENISFLQMKPGPKSKTGKSNIGAVIKVNDKLKCPTVAQYKSTVAQKNTSNDKPALQFNITVAVEELDDSSSELMIIEPEETAPVEIISSDSENETPAQISTDRTRTSKLNMLSKKCSENCDTTDRDMILKATSTVLKQSTNLADRILGAEVRNGLGQYPIQFKNTMNKIQKVLLQWQDWQQLLPVKYRSSPLFYKCYICEKSWWYLQDLVEHLKCHSNYMLDLEEYTMHEANVIAYSHIDNILDIKHFYTNGNCPKCENEYAIHKSTNRVKLSRYSCKFKSCYKQFPTCFTLKTHEYYHTLTDIMTVAYDSKPHDKQCEICGFLFQTKQMYENHMSLMHTVRSDLVIPIVNRKCNLCWADNRCDHNCARMGRVLHCGMCFRGFQRADLLRTHTNKIGRYSCSICNTVLYRQCMEAQHMLTHSENFTIVKKCIVCEDFKVYHNETDFLRHLSSHFDSLKDNFVTLYGCKIIVPKLYLTGNLEGTKDSEVEDKSHIEILAPILNVKEEILENFNSNPVDEEKDTPIKDEIDIEENFNADIILKRYEKEDTHSKIFGVKIEADEIKKEISDDYDSEFEEDIIKLDINFLQNTHEIHLQETKQEIKDETPTVSNRIEFETDIWQETNNVQESDSNDENESARIRLKRGKKLYRCHRCGLDAYHREYREHLKKSCHDDLYDHDSFPCTECRLAFDTFNQYIDHLSKHINKMSCPECYKTYDTYDAFKHHLATHIRVKFDVVQTDNEITTHYYTCKMCNERVDKKNFFIHWESHLVFPGKIVNVESDEVPYSEDMLKELIVRLKSPRRMHFAKKDCPVCVRHFDRCNDAKRHLVEHLLKHAFSEYSEYMGLKCQICSKIYDKPDAFKKHMRDHGSLRIYRCDECNKDFSDSSNYTKHRKLHNPNAYVCDICKKKFQIKVTLERHMILHRTSKRIECKMCDKVFEIESIYKKHCRTAHEKHRQRFSCRICGLKFFSLKEKWDHSWLVHKQRKHKADCLLCDQSFRRYRDLKNHIKDEHFDDVINCKTLSKKCSTLKVTSPVPGSSSQEETLVVIV